MFGWRLVYLVVVEGERVEVIDQGSYRVRYWAK